MKRILCVFLSVTSLACAAPVQEADSQQQAAVVAGNAYIPKGTVLRAELVNTLDSAVCNAGDKFTFKLLHHLIIANKMVIPKGTVGEGIVKSVKRAGAFGKGGKIELEVLSIKTQSGIIVPLSLAFRQAGGGHEPDLSWYDSNTVSATPALTVGIMSGLAGGNNVQIAAGTKLTITLPFNVDLGPAQEETAKEDGKTQVPANQPETGVETKQ